MDTGGRVDLISANEKIFTYIIDPNPSGRDIPPPENYIMYASFRALPKNRSLIETDGTYTNDTYNERGVSFITSSKQGKDKYLTTNFTNLGGLERQSECFGIDNIQIVYGADYAPLITIEFTDIRGGGLFNNYEIEDNDGIKYNTSELAVFFRLPYPLFELTIKGFYGRAVSYCLHLQKWNARFDANTGSFKITAEFVGYTYAFFADMLMKYVNALVNTSAGQNHLAKINKIYGSNVPTIDEFMSKIGTLTRIGEKFKIEDTEYKQLTVLNTLIVKLQDIQNVIGGSLIADRGFLYTQPILSPSIIAYTDDISIRDVILVNSKVKNQFIEFENELNAAISDVNNFISNNKSVLSKLGLPSIDGIIGDDSDKVFNSELDIILRPMFRNNGDDVDLELIKFESFSLEFTVLPENVFIKNFYKIRKSVQTVLDICLKSKKTQVEIVNDKLAQVFREAVGFDLTVQNVFNILVGNVEAALNVVYDVALAADSPNIESDRKSKFRLTKSDSSDGKIYPFPQVVDPFTGEEKWLGDVIRANDPAFPESKLVIEVLNNLVSLSKKIDKEQRESIREDYSDVITSTPQQLDNTQPQPNSSNPNNIGTPATAKPAPPTGGNTPQTIGDWTPIHPADIYEHPFGYFKTSRVVNNEIPQEFTDAVLKRLAILYGRTGATKINQLVAFARSEAYFAKYNSNKQLASFIENLGETQFLLQNLANTRKSTIIKDNSVKDLKIWVADLAQQQISIEGVAEGQQIYAVAEANTVQTDFETISTAALSSLMDQKTSQRLYYSKMNYKNGLVMYDLSYANFTPDVNAAIESLYKFKTGRSIVYDDTEKNIFPIISILPDMSFIEGYKNNISLDVSPLLRETTQLRLQNCAFSNIGRHYFTGIPTTNNSPFIFEQEYYKNLDNQSIEYNKNFGKAWLLLSSIPFNNLNITDFNIPKAGQVYFQKLYLVWLAMRYVRSVTYNDSVTEDVFDIMDNLVSASPSVKQQTRDQLYQRTNRLQKIPATQLLPSQVGIQLSLYVQSWLKNNFATFETTIILYCKNQQFLNTADSQKIAEFNSAQNILLALFTDTDRVTIMDSNFKNDPKSVSIPQNLLVEYAKTFYQSYKNAPLSAIEQFSGGVSPNNTNATPTNGASTNLSPNVNTTVTTNLTTSTSSDNKKQTNGNSYEEYLDDKDMKLSVYRYLKNIYDKWIAGGAPDGKIHNYCAYSRGGTNDKSLISRFHFIDRTWSYIGDKAVINPNALMVLSEQPDLNFYTLIGELAQKSNMLFFVLPTFVNYRNIEDVQSMFKQYQTVEDVSSGASVVLMYVGGTSKVLDIGKNTYFVNDSFDLHTYDSQNIPSGFKNRRVPINFDELDDSERSKYNMVAFRVAYGDQNQSFWKSVNVGMDNKKETGESLYATHQMFDVRGGQKRSYKGNNLYNVMAVRSYKCEVEAMGNMQIQPLTYFQLDNVPFFHGAYMISKVSHTVVPGDVQTRFEGYRMPRFVMPVVENSTTYLNIPIDETLLKDSERFFKIQPDTDGDSYIDGDDIIAYDPNSTPLFSGNVLNPGAIQSLPSVVGTSPAGFALANVAPPNYAQVKQNGILVYDGRGKTRGDTRYLLDPSVSYDEFVRRLNYATSPNTVSTYGLPPKHCQGHTKLVLRDAGLYQVSGDGYMGGSSAWAMFTQLPTERMYFLSNLRSQWSNSEIREEIIRQTGQDTPCFIYGYYPGSTAPPSAYDVITQYSPYYTNKLTQQLQNNAKAPKFNNSSYNTYPFRPVTHVGIYNNGYVIHSVAKKGAKIADARTDVKGGFVWVAFYPFLPDIAAKAQGGGALTTPILRSINNTLGGTLSNVTPNTGNNITTTNVIGGVNTQPFDFFNFF